MSCFRMLALTPFPSLTLLSREGMEVYRTKADPNRDYLLRSVVLGLNIPLLLGHGSRVSMLSVPYQEILTLDFSKLRTWRQNWARS